MLLHRSVATGGNLGPSFHLWEDKVSPLYAVSFALRYSLEIVIWLWPVRIYARLSWSKEAKPKLRLFFDCLNLAKFRHEYRDFLEQTNGFGYDALGRRDYLKRELTVLESQYKFSN